ncbi:ribosomal protein S18-alanine N-acetyltransferase [Gudongella sp. DL1XJH-153]|uniref:ribosomal protein S18-alanine N-acetyltransferase n=1 Tax=Gudongella sp. DL1XJH-153 TaxID=3409804 RepID=UPI003BB550ED
MRIILREMTKEDIREVLEIEKATFTTPWSEESFEKEIVENMLAMYIVAEVDSQIAGYGGLWKILDEGHITNIAVRKDFRGKGIGDALVMGIVDYCEKNGIPNITLEVRESNTVARSLYSKHGFVDAGKRPGYYTDTKEDAIIMWRKQN